MNTKFCWMKAVAGLLLTATTVGQSMRADQTVKVPFPFVVSGQTFTAGTYMLTKIGESRLRISSQGGRRVVVQTHTVQGHAPEDSGRLVFHRYGDIYFLSEVWSPAQDIGLQLSRSRGELQMKNTEARIETATLRLQK